MKNQQKLTKYNNILKPFDKIEMVLKLFLKALKMSNSKKHTCAKHNKREILENIDALIYCSIPDRYRESIAEKYEFKEWVGKDGYCKVKILGWDCAIQKLEFIAELIKDLCKNINKRIRDNIKLTEETEKYIEDNIKLMKENENCKSQFNKFIEVNKLTPDTHIFLGHKYENKHDILMTHFNEYLEVNNLTTDYSQFLIENKYDR